MQTQLERPSMSRAEEFVSAAKRSRTLHKNRVTPPRTLEEYREFLKRARRKDQESFFVVIERSGDLAGVVNIGNIVRGSFQSAYLAYYGFAPNASKGFIRDGVGQAISYAFRQLRLHRLEANIQPNNDRSIGLVRSLGFRLEGTSPRFLKVSGRWRDHQRWAILAEEWHPPKQTVQRKA